MPSLVGFSKPIGCALIPGGPVGPLKVPGGLRAGCTLLSVLDITDGTPPTKLDRTAEYSIPAGTANTVQGTVANTTGRYLHILWAEPA